MIDATPNTEITPLRVQTLKKRGDFLRLRSSRYHHTRFFILQCAKRTDGRTDEGKASSMARVGYTVTKKTGNSVERSRIKRRLREAVRLAFHNKANHENDYVLIAKRPSLNGEFLTITKDLSLALDRVHANRANGAKSKFSKAGAGAEKSEKKSGRSDGRK